MPKEKRPVPDCYNACMGLYRAFCEKELGRPPFLEGRQGPRAKEALCNMIAYLRQLPTCPTDEKVVQAFELVFDNWGLLSDWPRKQTDLPDIERNFSQIINEIRTASQSGKLNKRAREIAKEQRLAMLRSTGQNWHSSADGGAE